MQSFRTPFSIEKFPFNLDYDSKCIFIGSCFTENMGNYLKDLKFNIELNPTGIIYNPISIHDCIHFLINKKTFTEEDLTFYHDNWISFNHHGRFSDPEKNTCLENINTELLKTSKFFKETDFLFITFGSASIYTHTQTTKIVANCHKFPSSTFSKSILTPDNIISIYTDLITLLSTTNPSLKIIFTISPVRHWKDGAIENQHSKSVLFVAIHQLIKQFESCYYFPAYELMMDDLRDYRFYAEDMIHPTQTAIGYIREKFIQSICDAEIISITNELQKLIQAKNHRPLHSNTLSHKQFRNAQLRKIEELKKRIPKINLDEFELFFKDTN